MACIDIIHECIEIFKNECPTMFSYFTERNDKKFVSPRKEEKLITVQPCSSSFSGETDWEVIDDHALKYA